MLAKRPRRDINIKGALRDVDYTESPVEVIHNLMNALEVDLAMLGDYNSEDEKNTLPNVTYQQVAPLVGLEDDKDLTDIETFEIHRSRIPINLLKSIVTDMDMMLMQYGTPNQHRTVEARARFYSPILNHLVKQFNFMLRNQPEVVAGDDYRIGTKGRIQNLFKAFGIFTMLFVEKKLELENDENRLQAIAEIIAEVHDRELDNKSDDYSLPIYCVFSHDWTFEFFKFERKPNPSFTRGCFPGDPRHLRRGLHLPDFTCMSTALPFILQLRLVCETIFDMMLSAHIEGLKANYARLVQDKGKWRESKWSSLDGWDKAIQSAEFALAAFRRGEDQREAGDIDSANEIVDQALLALQESTNAVPTIYKSKLFMNDWDEAEVRKA